MLNAYINISNWSFEDCDNKAWDWAPWKKVLSEKWAAEVKERCPLLVSLEPLLRPFALSLDLVRVASLKCGP